MLRARWRKESTSGLKKQMKGIPHHSRDCNNSNRAMFLLRMPPHNLRGEKVNFREQCIALEAHPPYVHRTFWCYEKKGRSSFVLLQVIKMNNPGFKRLPHNERKKRVLRDVI